MNNSILRLLSATLILTIVGCGGDGGSDEETSLVSDVSTVVTQDVVDLDIVEPESEPEEQPEPDPDTSSEPAPVDVQNIKTENVAISLSNIPNLQYQNVNSPVTTVTGPSRPMLAPNADGTWDYIASYYSAYWYNQDVISIDMGTKEIFVDERPSHEDKLGRSELWTGQSGAIAPNRKLFILTRSTPNWQVHVYNPDLNKIERSLDLPDYVTGGISNIITGIDGYIYVASGRKDSGYVTAFRINPDTYAIQKYGKIGNTSAAQSEHIYADATHIYVVTGRSPYTITTVPISATTSDNTINAQSSVLASLPKLIEIYISKYGASTQVGTTKYWLYQGGLHNYSAGEPWSNGNDGKHYVWNTTPEDVTWSNKPKIDNTLMGGDSFNKLWYTTTNGSWDSVEFEGPTYPQTVHRIAKLADGTLIGGGAEYSGIYLFDPKTNESDYLGHIGLSHYTTSVYTSKITGEEKVLLSGYPNSSVFIYEPGKENKNKITQDFHPGIPSTITPADELNPKSIGNLYSEAGCKKMYASAVGADANIYFGGKWRDNGTAGCLGWVNGDTLAKDGFYDIFTNYQVRDLTSTGNGRYIVIATTGIKDATGSKPTPTKGRIFIYDTTKGKNQTMITVDPIDSIDSGAIVGVEGNMVVGIASDVEHVSGFVYKLDASTGKMVYRKSIDLPIAVSGTSNQFSGNPIRYYNGVVWFNGGGAWTSKYLVKVMQGGVMRAVGKIPYPINAGDFEFVGNDMFSAGETSIRKVSNIFDY